MKTNKIRKTLTLKKVTIANLRTADLNGIKGGGTIYVCTPRCTYTYTYLCCTIPPDPTADCVTDSPAHCPTEAIATCPTKPPTCPGSDCC
jgi:hypothetical protein